MRVLVVDDESSIRSLISMTLAAAGHSMTTASNGAEALERIRAADSDPFDVIVLDLQMPVMDGRTFYEELRSLPSDIPVLLLSA